MKSSERLGLPKRGLKLAPERKKGRKIQGREGRTKLFGEARSEEKK